MNDYCGRFDFPFDMNGDMAFTITDVSLLVGKVWHLPSNTVIWLLERDQAIATFLELDCNTGRGWAGGTLSLIGWMFVIGIFSLIVNRIDRYATAREKRRNLRTRMGYDK